MAATLLNHWTSYKVQCVPLTATRGQIDATREAFYGGAAMVMLTLEEIGQPEISDDEGWQILEGFKREVFDFMAKHKMKHGI